MKIKSYQVKKKKSLWLIICIEQLVLQKKAQKEVKLNVCRRLFALHFCLDLNFEFLNKIGTDQYHSVL